MAIWSFGQIIGLWRAAGGPAGSEEVAAAVAIAESSGNDFAISPTADYGLWQINANVWFGRAGDCGIGWGNWYQPSVNACAAVHISGGHNFGAWCTMWADPARDCATGYLSYPQAGSRALAVLTQYGGAGGQPSGGGGGPPAASTAGVTASWGNIQAFFGADARIMFARIGSVRQTARSLWEDLGKRG